MKDTVGCGFGKCLKMVYFGAFHFVDVITMEIIIFMNRMDLPGTMLLWLTLFLPVQRINVAVTSVCCSLCVTMHGLPVSIKFKT